MAAKRRVKGPERPASPIGPAPLACDLPNGGKGNPLLWGHAEMRRLGLPTKYLSNNARVPTYDKLDLQNKALMLKLGIEVEHNCELEEDFV